MKVRTLIPERDLKEFKTLRKEMSKIKMNVEKILFILENEGEVRENILRELKIRSKTAREKCIPHDEAKKTLMK